MKRPTICRWTTTISPFCPASALTTCWTRSKVTMTPVIWMTTLQPASEEEAAAEEEESPGAPEEDYVESAALDSDLAELDEDERLRQPRALLFRRRLRNQVNMLPLALYLLALGGYLIARQQDVNGLPDLSTLAIGSMSVLALAFTIIFRAC